MELGGIPDAFQTLLAFAAFVIPGFLLRAGYVRSRAVSENVPALYILAEAVAGSLAVLAIAWWWRAQDMLEWARAGTLSDHQGRAYWFFLVLLLAPYPLGLLAGWFVNGLAAVYERFRPPDESRGPRHWLYYFMEVGGVFNGPTLWDDIWDDLGRKAPLILRVRTTTGRETVGAVEFGTWAENSPRPRELFLRRVYVEDDEGIWRADPASEGMFFHESSIESLEFFQTNAPSGSQGEEVVSRDEGPRLNAD